MIWREIAEGILIVCGGIVLLSSLLLVYANHVFRNEVDKDGR